MSLFFQAVILRKFKPTQRNKFIPQALKCIPKQILVLKLHQESVIFNFNPQSLQYTPKQTSAIKQRQVLILINQGQILMIIVEKPLLLTLFRNVPLLILTPLSIRLLWLLHLIRKPLPALITKRLCRKMSNHWQRFSDSARFHQRRKSCSRN